MNAGQTGDENLHGTVYSAKYKCTTSTALVLCYTEFFTKALLGAQSIVRDIHALSKQISPSSPFSVFKPLDTENRSEFMHDPALQSCHAPSRVSVSDRCQSTEELSFHEHLQLDRPTQSQHALVVMATTFLDFALIGWCDRLNLDRVGAWTAPPDVDATNSLSLCGELAHVACVALSQATTTEHVGQAFRRNISHGPSKFVREDDILQ